MWELGKIANNLQQNILALQCILCLMLTLCACIICAKNVGGLTAGCQSASDGPHKYATKVCVVWKDILSICQRAHTLASQHRQDLNKHSSSATYYNTPCSTHFPSVAVHRPLSGTETEAFIHLDGKCRWEIYIYIFLWKLMGGFSYWKKIK